MAGRKRLGDLLVAGGAITEQQLDRALEFRKKPENKDKRLGQCLVELGYTTDQRIASALASQLHMRSVDLFTMDINKEIVNLAPADMMRKNTMVPVSFENGRIVLAVADPLNFTAIDDFSVYTSMPCDPVVAPESQINTILDRFYGNEEAQAAAEKFSKERQARDKAEEESKAEEDKETASAPIVQLVRVIIEQAVRSRASDIHIDALERYVRIRYRIDGVLVQGQKDQDIRMLPAISTRIKIMSGLDISERRKPQDGRITVNVDREEYDIRVSILPTSFGEKIVMRLAKANALTRSKAELGLQPYELKHFNHMLKKPNGIILVTGPTGSGKSTTLYTALSELNTPEVNIMTIEDPVEANIPGVNQVQVNPKAGLTFATALRSFLRQDPDIIMVGEIRDQETAGIAVQASITGHLVVSTLHTNSAAASVTRLIDMGVEPYLLADSLTGIIAQRLVRRLHKDCMRYQRASEAELRDLGYTDDANLTTVIPKGARYVTTDGGRVPEDSSRGRATENDGIPTAVAPADLEMKGLWVGAPGGCPHCNHTGYFGRIGIYEVMDITTRLRTIISKGLGTEAIEEEAKKEGLRTLRENAAYYVRTGVTTTSEMLKVAMQEDDVE